MGNKAAVQKEKVKRIMKKQKMFVITVLCLVLVVMLAAGCAFSGARDATLPTEPAGSEQEDSLIVLYQGCEISTRPGVQTPFDMDITEANMEKYNIAYFNYENGAYQGMAEGNFGEPTYEGASVVQNVGRIALSQKYDAIPRDFTETTSLPPELMDLADCTAVTIHSIDLDGDGSMEHLVCYQVDHAQGEIGDGQPQASSGIMLFDEDYKKIADLVTLEEGFWARLKDAENKVFLSLQDVDYIDMDQDGAMEIILKIPTYEGLRISILKYQNGKLEGETGVEASLLA